MSSNQSSRMDCFPPWVNLYRPHRKAYLQEKKNVNESCVFCLAIKNPPSFEFLCLYKDNFTTVLLNKYPYNVGHLLVLPLSHKAKLSELSSDESHSLMSTLTAASVILEKSYKCEAMNMGLNQGRNAGAGLPDHIHMHLIPRWIGDANFFPLIGGGKVFSESLEQTYQRLKPDFDQLDIN